MVYTELVLSLLSINPKSKSTIFKKVLFNESEAGMGDNFFIQETLYVLYFLSQFFGHVYLKFQLIGND